jgi:hypothetical protein
MPRVADHHPLALLGAEGLEGYHAAMQEAAGLAQGAHVRALTRPDHAEEILHHLVQRLLDRSAFAGAAVRRDAFVADMVYAGAWGFSTPLRDAPTGATIPAEAEAEQHGLADAVAQAAAPPPRAARPPRLTREARSSAARAAQPPVKWTPAREALLHQHAGTMTARALLRLVNAEPGLPIASPGALRVKARSLGLAVFTGLAPDPDASPEELAAAAIERGRVSAAAMGLGEWTEERLAVLRAEYDTAETLEALLARINAMPGNPIASVESMQARAKREGLRRKRRVDPAHMAKMSALWRAKKAAIAGAQASGLDQLQALAAEVAPAPPAEAAPEPAPPPTTAAAQRARQRAIQTPWIREIVEAAEPAAPTVKQSSMVAPEAPPVKAIPPSDWAAPGVLTEAAERDAVEQFMAGTGARALYENFGEPSLDWWQAWCERQRKGRAA